MESEELLVSRILIDLGGNHLCIYIFCYQKLWEGIREILFQFQAYKKKKKEMLVKYCHNYNNYTTK